MEIEVMKIIKCSHTAVRAVRFNVDGSYCLTCGADKKLKLWNPYKSLYLLTYGGHADEVTDASGSSDSSHIISCGCDKTVILWDVSSGQVIRRFRGHTGRINCVKFNEDSTVAVTGSHDNSLMCWDVKSRKSEPIQIMKEGKDCITAVQVTDHEILASCLDGYVRNYDLRMGRVVNDMIGDPVTSTCFTQDTQCFLATSRNIIRLMDKETGEMLAQYKGHTTKDYVIESCVDSKDQFILSGSADGKLYSWELISGAVSKIYEHVNSKTVHSISPHPSRNYFLTAAADEIFLWGPKTTGKE